MTPCLLTAARALLPFLAAELVVLGVQWFLIPEDSWLSYVLGSVSLVALPLLAALRLTRLSFNTGPAVLSALSFTALGLVWAACATALGYAGADWRPYLLGVVISFTLFGAPVQLLAAYIGTRYARHTAKAAT
jgi:hypothetical protein